VAEGKLRLDLYHRLNMFPVFLPRLCERLEDLPLLIRHLLDSAGYADMTVSLKVMEVFQKYSWLGNICELRNVLVRADQELIQHVLQEGCGNISQAAKRLGIHRITLHRRLCHYGLMGRLLPMTRCSRQNGVLSKCGGAT
jgi:DNA-binding NtrC family response regulator